MAARTEGFAIFAILAIALAGVARADAIEKEILGESGWALERAEFRTMYLDQNGRGFQSVEDGNPGKEAMWIVHPALLLNIRQSERVSHVLTLPFDAITAASPDAVDATTSASRFNIAGDLDLRTTIRVDEDDTITTRFVAHAEEWIGGGTIGAGWKRSLAEDNATVSVNGTFGLDVFDDHNHLGDFLGKTTRTTASVNAGASQLLSPTTVLDGSYGATYQRGTLRTGWNAVPTEAGLIDDEVFPGDRLRQSLAVRVSQHLPSTRSTVKARLRGYTDSFGLRAYAIEASVYQYLVDWLYVRGSYRFYDQTGVEFYTEQLPLGFDMESPDRTSDSDLAPLHAHEFSISFRTVPARGPLEKWSLSGEFFRYQRSNNLRIQAVAFSIGRVM